MGSSLSREECRAVEDGWSLGASGPAGLLLHREQWEASQSGQVISTGFSRLLTLQEEAFRASGSHCGVTHYCTTAALTPYNTVLHCVTQCYTV